MEATDQLDRPIERRSLMEDDRRTEEAWAEGVRKHHARLSEERRGAWCEFHEHMRCLHEALAEEHRRRAESLLGEAP